MVGPVMGDHRQDTAVLMIRAWRDGSAPSGFRARVVQVFPPTPPESTVAVNVEQVLAVVTEWLQRFGQQSKG
jgi:hypothetical protein